MRAVNAFFMSLSTFCALPCPIRKWDEEARPLMILTLPFVGLWIGLLWYALSLALIWLKLPRLLAAAFCAAFIYLITGFIHLDGFMDVCDAIGSYKSLEERRTILKDSHNGSFAFISLSLLLICMFAAFASADAIENRILIFIPFVSRAMSGVFINCLKPLPASQYAGAYRDNIKKTHTALLVAFVIGAVIIAYFWLGDRAGVLIAEIIAHSLAVTFAYRNLDGINGDVSGFAITLSELFAVIVMVLI